MNIDWDAVNGIVARAPKPPTFSDDQIAAAVAAIGSLPAKGNDPDVVKTLWDRPKHMPGIDEVDFRDVKYPKLTIATLKASNKTLSRTRLVWHVQNPGVALHPGPFTTNPIVLGKKNSQVIVDGHHRLAALMLLGQMSWPCALVPSK